MLEWSVLVLISELVVSVFFFFSPLLAVCMVAPAFLAECLKECEMPWRVLCPWEFSETIMSSQNWKNFGCIVLLSPKL